MLSLIKIRVKYIIRKPCLLFWTYLFIPIIILIVAIVVIKNKKKKDLKSFESIIFPEETKFFNENEDYIFIREYINLTGFQVEDEKDCNTISSLLTEYDLCNPKCPICTEKESNFDNFTMNIISIKKKKGKYNVELTSRNTNIGLFESFYLFTKDDLSQDTITDPYYLGNFGDDSIYEQKSKYYIYFQLQSLISRILIKLEGKTI